MGMCVFRMTDNLNSDVPIWWRNFHQSCILLLLVKTVYEIQNTKFHSLIKLIIILKVNENSIYYCISMVFVICKNPNNNLFEERTFKYITHAPLYKLWPVNQLNQLSPPKQFEIDI